MIILLFLFLSTYFGGDNMGHAQAPAKEENKRLQRYSDFEYEPSHHHPTSQLNSVYIFQGTGTRDIIQII